MLLEPFARVIPVYPKYQVQRQFGEFVNLRSINCTMLQMELQMVEILFPNVNTDNNVG